MATKRKVKLGEFQPSGDITRVVSLGQGTFAYVFDQKGKTHHLKRSSDAMAVVCRSTDRALGGKIRERLAEMGWEDVIERMDSLPEEE